MTVLDKSQLPSEAVIEYLCFMYCVGHFMKRISHCPNRKDSCLPKLSIQNINEMWEEQERRGKQHNPARNEHRKIPRNKEPLCAYLPPVSTTLCFSLARFYQSLLHSLNYQAKTIHLEDCYQLF